MLEVLHVNYHRVLMVVSANVQMTWGKLAVALKGITKFLGPWGLLSCNFVVGEDGWGWLRMGLWRMCEWWVCDQSG